MPALIRHRYRLTSGRFSRFEGGVLARYKVGDIVYLSDHEADVLKSCIEPAPDDNRADSLLAGLNADDLDTGADDLATASAEDVATDDGQGDTDAPEYEL